MNVEVEKEEEADGNRKQDNSNGLENNHPESDLIDVNIFIAIEVFFVANFVANVSIAVVGVRHSNDD